MPYLGSYSTHGIVQVDGEKGWGTQFILSAPLPLPKDRKAIMYSILIQPSSKINGDIHY